MLGEFGAEYERLLKALEEIDWSEMKHLITGMIGLLKKEIRFVSFQRLIRVFFFLFFINSLFPAYPALANPGQNPGREDFIKAGFLYNFTKFIKWPKNYFPMDEFVIGVLNESDNPFKKSLDLLSAKKKKVNGRKLVIRHFSSPDEITKCHILFVNSSMEGRLREIMEILGNSPVLLVGDTPGFAEKGVGVNFFTQKNKIRFEFNRKSLKRAGLKVDSQLLEVGRIVK